MAEFGRAAFTIAGSFFGPWGTLIGGFLGSLLFPVEGPKGPRLSELNIQHSTVGSAIPIVYGTAKLAGNVIFSGGLVETEHEGGGGKGGPSGPTTYSYAVDVAIGICEGPIGGIRRIWADADVIYDASEDATLQARLELGGVDAGSIAGFLDAIRATSAQLDFDLYLGDEDQLPDPTIESHVGVGATPSYRGLAYIVFPNFQLEKYGNRIPNFRFEVFTLGTETECGTYSPGELYPWFITERDPRNDANVHYYSNPPGTGGGPVRATLEEAMADGGMSTWSPDPNGWSHSTAPNYTLNCAGDTSDYIGLYLELNYIHGGFGWTCENGPNPFPPPWGNVYDPILIAIGPNNLMYSGMPQVGAGGPGLYWFSEGFATQAEAEATSCPDPGMTTSVPGTWGPGGGVEWRRACRHTSQEIAVSRDFTPRSPYAGLTWTQVIGGTFKCLQFYRTGTAGFRPGRVIAYPCGPCLRSDSPFYNDEDYWTAAYADALEAGALLNGEDGPIPDDWVYGVDYPAGPFVADANTDFVWQMDCTAVETECVTMATIVADICHRAGLRTDTDTQIDVSELTTCVQGYVIARQMSAREALGPLRMYGLWDAVESADATGGILKFIERGHALVDTLTTDDLGVHEAGAEPPTAVEVTRIQEKELPRRVRLHFLNFLFDHEVSEQSASRITTEAIDEVDIELAISMEPDTAKQLAEISLYEAYVSRNRYRFSLDHEFLHLEPTDCIEIPVDGETQRVRIVAVEYQSGIINVDAVRDDDGAYQSTAVAIPGTPSGGLPGSSGGGPICDSAVVLLDIPCLTGTPPTGEVWIYGAVYGTCPDFWNCATLYRSDDGGETYAQVARTDQETTVGTIDDITGPATDPTLPGDSPPYDTSNSITVTLYEGTLASVSDDGIAAGLNLAAIGQNGRWVIVQFKTATLDTGDTWVLTDLIWGVNGTEHLLGTTVAGDTFVLLSDSALLRIPLPADAIGVAKQYKIVSCGQSLDAISDFSFTTWGLCYQRLCPSTVISATLTTPPTGAADGDAYLLPDDTSLSGVWANHGGEITFWSNDTDSWQFCLPVPGTVIHIIGDSSDAAAGEDVIAGGDGTYSPAPWASSAATFVTVEDERTRLPNSLRLVGVDGVTVTPNTDGELEIGPPPAAGSLLSAPGDLLTYDTGEAVLPVGDDGLGLVTDSDQSVGIRWGAFGIPSRAMNTDHTIEFIDNGYGLDHQTAGGSGDVYLIDSHANLALPIGFTFSAFNMAPEDLTVDIVSDTLYELGTGATGPVTIVQYGGATFRKVANTSWLWWGVGAST